jgi:ubiquinone/menaquinone biosynthesis C-methylase UbiE
LLFVLLSTVYQGITTLIRLQIVERERDRWQRPAEIIRALNPKQGSVVVDFGSGAGYFALKLSSAVGGNGRVIAVDTRRLPLSFLWLRAMLRAPRNVAVIHGDASDPHLPEGAVDAVPIANTYHELTDPQAILACIFRSLIAGGRLVIVDRGPRQASDQPREIEAEHHERSPAQVESEACSQGFEIIARQDHFIDRPDEPLWWLIVARKP